MNIVAIATFSFFALLLVLQTTYPKRAFSTFSTRRFQHNVLLFALNFGIFLIVPASLYSIALFAEAKQWGLFNHIHSIHPIVGVVLAVILLDFIVYVQHVVSHKWHWLWRLHQVHHADKQIEVTTAVRFHPVELILSLAYKGFFVCLLGASTQSVIIFETLLITGAAFSHSNWRLTPLVDKVLRYVIVTPDVHRVHHSVHREEHDSNFGFFLVWWDKLFGTYTAQPKDGHEKMQIGLSYTRQSLDCEEIRGMLKMPLQKMNAGEQK